MSKWLIAGMALLWVWGTSIAAEGVEAYSPVPGNGLRPKLLPDLPPRADNTAHDSRLLVDLEAAVEWLSLVSMRDYLITIMQVTEFVARGEFQRAAHLTERRIGLQAAESVLITRVLEQSPVEYRSLTEDLHQAGTRLAELARREDQAGTLDAMADVMQVCVTCHAQYRFR